MLLTVLKCIVTGRNEVVAKVIFLHLSVILFTGGSASVHAGIPPPPRPGTLPDQAHTPQTRHPPGTEHAGRYGQRADGTHPTGMQSCCCNILEMLT